LGGAVSPGVVKLSGHDREQNWTVAEAKGQSGATTTYQGEKVAKFKATFSLIFDPVTGQDDFEAWDAFQKVIESMTAGTNPFALPIYHPDLARQRITEVSNGKVGGMVYDDKGGGTVEVEFLEFKPPKKKGGKATAKSKVQKSVENAGQALNDQLLDALKSGDPLTQGNNQLDELLKEAQSP
jgi:hypothetical protein